MKLFVAGLPYDMDDAELEEFFDKFGIVHSAKVTMDKETGKAVDSHSLTCPMPMRLVKPSTA